MDHDNGGPRGCRGNHGMGAISGRRLSVVYLWNRRLRVFPGEVTIPRAPLAGHTATHLNVSAVFYSIFYLLFSKFCLILSASPSTKGPKYSPLCA